MSSDYFIKNVEFGHVEARCMSLASANLKIKNKHFDQNSI